MQRKQQQKENIRQRRAAADTVLLVLGWLPAAILLLLAFLTRAWELVAAAVIVLIIMNILCGIWKLVIRWDEKNWFKRWGTQVTATVSDRYTKSRKKRTYSSTREKWVTKTETDYFFTLQWQHPNTRQVYMYSEEVSWWRYYFRYRVGDPWRITIDFDDPTYRL